MNSNTKQGLVAGFALVAGLASLSLLLELTVNPYAFTTKRVVHNVTLAVRPVNQPKHVVQIAPVTIVGRVSHEEAAMTKRPASRSKAKKQQPCKYRIVGYNDDKFQSWRGVFYCAR